MAVASVFDLLIVGGGINGAGIARDAAGRGLRVMLVEQASLARYTSSASTKLVHGGLRYLEYFHFRLVREALLERGRLLAIAPHLVRRKRFVLPYERRLRPAWVVRLGLFFYDYLVRRNSLERSSDVRFATSPFGRPMRARACGAALPIRTARSTTAGGDSAAAMYTLYDPSPYQQAYWCVCLAWGLAVTLAIHVTGAVSGTHAGWQIALRRTLAR